MPRIAKFQLPDGRIAKFQVSDDTTPEQVHSFIEQNLQNFQTQKEPSFLEKAASSIGENLSNYIQEGKNVGGGLIKGASNIGSTILAPVDAAARALGIQNEFIGRNDRRQSINDFMDSHSIDRNSLGYGGGKLVSEIAGTAGLPSVLGKGLASASKILPQSVPYIQKLANAIESGGLNLGEKYSSVGSPIANAATRIAGGALSGAAQAAAINPDDATTGAVIGGAIPGIAKASGALGDMAGNAIDKLSEKLMYSALKPTKKMHETGSAARAIKTLLDEGINVSQGGLEKLKGKISDTNDLIANAIQDSNAIINKNKVISALNDTRNMFMRDVSPETALQSIQNVETGFANHPLIQGDEIPVQLAQELKQGTYKTLNKSYGELKSAEVEARKALARGLKEQIAEAIPGIQDLNTRDSNLINALKVLKNRVPMDANKNPISLGDLVAKNKVGLIASILSGTAPIKATMARGLNSLRPGISLIDQALLPNVDKSVLKTIPIIWPQND